MDRDFLAPRLSALQYRSLDRFESQRIVRTLGEDLDIALAQQLRLGEVDHVVDPGEAQRLVLLEQHHGRGRQGRVVAFGQAQQPVLGLAALGFVAHHRQRSAALMRGVAQRAQADRDGHFATVGQVVHARAVPAAVDCECGARGCLVRGVVPDGAHHRVDMPAQRVGRITAKVEFGGGVQVSDALVDVQRDHRLVDLRQHLAAQLTRRCVGTGEGEYLRPLGRLHDHRIDLAAVDCGERVLGLPQPGAQFSVLRGQMAHEITMSSATRTCSLRDMSPMKRRRGNGSDLIKVGAATRSASIAARG